MGIQGNKNSFFTCYFKVVLDRFSWNLEFVPDDSISHYWHNGWYLSVYWLSLILLINLFTVCNSFIVASCNFEPRILTSQLISGWVWFDIQKSWPIFALNVSLSESDKVFFFFFFFFFKFANWVNIYFLQLFNIIILINCNVKFLWLNVQTKTSQITIFFSTNVKRFSKSQYDKINPFLHVKNHLGVQSSFQ